MIWFVIWLIPIVSVLGWWVGYRSKQGAITKIKERLHPQYFLGMNYLINDQPDKAVDALLKLLEVDNDTMETHLALGSLFRRRGEVDRAIRVHQNIIARPELEPSQRVQALVELGKDYLKAGVLDRAEKIFQELVEEGEESHSSLKWLLSIYEQQKDWHQAILCAEKIQRLTGESQANTIAHYYCSIAEEHWEARDPHKAKQDLKQALSSDKNCARASILFAQIAEHEDDDAAAIKYYQKVCKQDPDYICHIIHPIVQCYFRLGQREQALHFLLTCLEDQPTVTIMMAVVQELQHQHGDDKAIQFLSDHNQRYPSLQGIDRLIQLYLLNPKGELNEQMSLLKNLVGQLLAQKSTYRCNHCGFNSSELYWHCPGCKHWGTIRLLH